MESSSTGPPPLQSDQKSQNGQILENGDANEISKSNEIIVKEDIANGIPIEVVDNDDGNLSLYYLKYYFNSYVCLSVRPWSVNPPAKNIALHPASE